MFKKFIIIFALLANFSFVYAGDSLPYNVGHLRIQLYELREERYSRGFCDSILEQTQNLEDSDIIDLETSSFMYIQKELPAWQIEKARPKSHRIIQAFRESWTPHEYSFELQPDGVYYLTGHCGFRLTWENFLERLEDIE